MSVWMELRRRNVVKVAIAYGVVGWLLVQVADTFFPALQLPEWTVTLVAALVILGFPVALLLSWAFELTPAGIVRTPAGRVAAEAATALPLAPAPAAGEPAAAETAGVSTPPSAAKQTFLANSVAVLPLDNLSPDPDNAYFAAGLHEEILNQLAKLSDLNVISRTSVLQYAKDRPPIADIARTLNVQSIMEGSIRYAGNRIRATVQLIDSVTGAHLWSETYERQFDDVFAIESEIAINVANALEAELSREERRAVETAPTKSSEAYGIYLRLRSIRNSDVGLALRLCDQALEIDPDFALAHMTKSYLCAVSLVQNIGLAAIDEEERQSKFETLARRHADRALELDPSLDVSHLTHAILDMYSWHWSRAQAAFERVGINDHDDLGPQFAIWLPAYMGDVAKAIELGRRAVKLSPNDWRPRWALAVSLAYSGDLVAARATNRDAIAVNPSLPALHHWLAYIHVSLGERADALAELRLTEELMRGSRDLVSLTEVAYTYARLGMAEDVERLCSEIEQRAAGHDVGAGTWAMIGLAKGDLDGVADWIENAIDKAARHEIDQGFWPLMNIKMNAATDPALDEPRFVELRARIRGD